MTSADVESASLHPVKYGAALMEAATQAKDIGGVLATCVNTTVGNTDLESLFNIGRMADRLGFNQWSIGGLYKPCGPRMEDSLTEVQCREVLTAITREFEKSNLQIAVSVTPEIFQKWATESVPTPMSTAWRLERKISRNVTLIAPNLQRGFFLRLRWDGQLMDLNDVLTLSLKTGSFGTFRPGSVRRIIGSLPELQGRTHQENTFAKAA